MRVLALDVGNKRVGVAISDPSQVLARSLKVIKRSSPQADFAAVSRLLEEYEVERVVVDPDKCALCLTCIRSCPHHAIEVDHEKQTAKVIDIACQGCGICAGECPAKAIQLKGYTDDEIWAQLEFLKEAM